MMNLLIACLLFPCLLAAADSLSVWHFAELGRLPVEEAKQGVTADASCLYAIGNNYLGKNRKDTGERVAHWECPEGKALTHLNAGVVIGDKLYCTHSNYPGIPHHSSVEIWDTASLNHAQSIDLGDAEGSLSWITCGNGNWLACFVHSAKKSGMPSRSPEFTRLVEFDDDWRQIRTWKLLRALISDLSYHGCSLSGGAIGPKGLLFVTGHDEPIFYVFKFPDTSDELRILTSLPMTGKAKPSRGIRSILLSCT